ncbi:MAG: ATP-binding protein [Methanoregula sp.]
MIPDKQLEDLIIDQKATFLSRDPGTKRSVDFERYCLHAQIVVISGIRRSGKSTLMRQFACRYDDFYYINFDDERLFDFELADFSQLMIVFNKVHPGVRVMFIDEIQMVSGWERFIRRIHDEGYKIFLTGSNARLLGTELSTHLTGRYAKIELYPFAFTELLAFRQIDHRELTVKKKAELLGAFDDYLKNGGFPEFLKYRDTEFLKRIYDDILFRDIITRFGIRETKVFRQLVNYIFTNLTKEASYHSLKAAVQLRSPMSVRTYIGYLDESYLIFELLKYDRSLKKQYANPKKIYVIDNGMRNAVSFCSSADSGRLLENLVFIELRRRGTGLFYYRRKHECDFILEDHGVLVSAIQVCFDLNDENREREVNGLLESMKDLGIDRGMILTYNQDDVIRPDEGLEIFVVPVWRWLLEEPGRHQR